MCESPLHLDLVIFTVATGLDARTAMNTVRIPTYQALANHMRRQGKVLVVLDCVTTAPEFLALFTHPRRLMGRIRKHGVCRRSDNLYTYTPPLPMPLSILEKLPPVLRKAVKQILGAGLRSALRRTGLNNSSRVISVNDPRLHFVTGLVRESLLVYDCLDDYAQYGWETNPAKVLEREHELVQRANVIFATSRVLYDKMQAQHNHVYYFPNAVDFSFFNQATVAPTPIAPALANIPRPIVGFMGHLTAWYDFALLRSVIQARSDWSFVFIGWTDSRAELEAIRQMPNVHFLGTQEFEELPSFLKGFDAAIMPYQTGMIAQAVNPDKMYQYMAAGVPVVSTPIPEVFPFSEVIELASDSDGFIRALETCLFQDNRARIARQIAIARGETWDKRVGRQLAVIEELLRQVS